MLNSMRESQNLEPSTSMPYKNLEINTAKVKSNGHFMYTGSAIVAAGVVYV